MRMWTTLKYPVLAVAIVAASWVGLAVAQRSKRSNPKPPTANSGTPRVAEGETETNKAVSDVPPALGAAPESGSGWLGLRCKGKADDSQGQGQAVEAGQVIPGSPAAKAGIRKGDIILGVQGQPATNVEDVEEEISDVAPGTELLVELLRAGQPLQITVTRAPSPNTTREAQHGQLVAVANSSSPGVTPSGTAPSQQATGVFINGRQLTPQQIQEIRATYGFVAPPGRYWYDARSGLFGLMGWEAAGFMRPGHDFGPIPANASRGNTGVFINSREINLAEATYCQKLFGAVYQGRYWFDGRTGNLGVEGNPMPVVNVFVALQQAQRSNQGGYNWHSNITGASGGSAGGCSYVTIPGSGSVSSGCD